MVLLGIWEFILFLLTCKRIKKLVGFLCCLNFFPFIYYIICIDLGQLYVYLHTFAAVLSCLFKILCFAQKSFFNRNFSEKYFVEVKIIQIYSFLRWKIENLSATHRIYKQSSISTQFKFESLGYLIKIDLNGKELLFTTFAKLNISEQDFFVK